MSTPAPFQSYKVFAIVSTVIATILSILSCCCIPLGLAPGIPAIIYASKAEKLWAQGEETAAHATARTAKMWSWVTAGFGIFCLLLQIFSLVARSMGWVDDAGLKEMLEQMQQQQ